MTARNSIFSLLCFSIVLGSAAKLTADEPLRVGVFNVDASPQIGDPLAYDPCVEVTAPLSCRGIILLGSGDPIVLCAVDWLGVANEAHDQFRARLAEAVETTPQRVAVHAIHQHDAPRCDFTAATLLSQVGDTHPHYDVVWAREVFDRAAAAAKQASENARPFNAIGLGKARVEQVASNRRILGENGKVVATRYTACRDPKLRALPAGTVDPWLRSISLWHEDEPLVVLTYFATHPQSYYRTGQANPDFPGYARNHRQETTRIPHVHFNGAGGNIGAGKWNDGSQENRQVLTDRVAVAMATAWKSTEKQPLSVDEVALKSVPVQLPLGEHMQESDLEERMRDSDADPLARLTAAKHLAWLRRSRAGHAVDLQCLSLGPARVLHMPGELFVEYQLAATQMRPDLFVAIAAYGEYGPGYIGTAIAYDQGGYEASNRASRVAPGVERVLVDAMASLLDAEATAIGPLGE